jgi:hypothetical protein
VVDVRDGTLDLLFSALASEGGVNRPKISAIEVISYTSSAQARLAFSASSKPAPATPQLKVSAYPNPFQKEINLNMAEVPAGEYTLRVLDLAGRQLYQEAFTAGNQAVYTIPVSGRALTRGGLYLVVLEQEGGPFRKVIKMMKE